MKAYPSITLLLLSLCACMFTSCQTTGSDPRIAERNSRIKAEPRGNYYIGRRYYVDRTRFWGYLRKPGQLWENSKLVIINERSKNQPDRLPEEDTGNGPIHGFDHNYEYKAWGYFTGNEVYDPNSNFFVPEFRLQRYELMSSNPGFLFNPNHRYRSDRLPPKHPPIPSIQ